MQIIEFSEGLNSLLDPKGPIKNRVIRVSSKEIVKAKSPAIIRDNLIFGNRT